MRQIKRTNIAINFVFFSVKQVVYLVFSVIFSLSFNVVVSAQSDSLKKVLAQNLSQNDKVKTYNRLSLSYYPHKPDSAEFYVLKAIESAKIIGDYQNEFLALKTYAKILHHQGAKELAIKKAYMALGLAKTMQDQKMEKQVWGILTTFHLADRKYDSASYTSQQEYNISIARREKPDSIAGLALGVTFNLLRNGQFDNALELILKTKELIDTTKVSDMTRGLFYEQARNYYYITKQYPMAMEFANKALQIWTDTNDEKRQINGYVYIGEINRLTKNPAQGKSSIKTALRLSKKYKIDQFLLQIHQRLSYLYRAEDSLEYSLDHMYSVLAIAQARQDSARLVTTYYSIGEIYLLMGEIRKGKEYVLKSKDVFEEKKQELNLSKTREITIYRGLSRIDSIMGNWKGSLENYHIYAGLEEQINDIAVRDRIEKLKVEYERREKDREIKLLSTKNDLQKLITGQQQRTIVSILMVVLSLLALLAILYNRYRLKRRSMRIIQGKIRENEMLMREIHHRVKNNLQIMLSLLRTQSRLIDNDEAQAMVEQSSDCIKSMALIHENLYQSSNMLQVRADNYLKDLIDTMMASFGADAHKIVLKMDITSEKISMTTAVPIGLILNELITNAVKYAFEGQDDGELIINFRKSDNYYNLQVIDNGKGVSEGISASNQVSFGLQMIYGLTQELDGHLKVNKELGTRFDVYLKDSRAA